MVTRTEAVLRQRLTQAARLADEMAGALHEAQLLIEESPEEPAGIEAVETRDDSLRSALALVDERRHRRLVLLQD